MSDPNTVTDVDDTLAVSPDHTDPAAVRGARHTRDPLGVTDGALSSVSSSLSADTLAGRYELLALLGAGGMGSVYKARDKSLGELVAIKVLSPELSSDPVMITRFRQEVKLARRVTHVNVARTFDIGEHGPHLFLTMELITGASLTDTLRHEAPMPVERIVEIASAICAGLGAAHAAGVVHRDLKPDNVLIGQDGRVVITDFGIARVVDPAQHEAVKTIGMPIGTPAYMAPEQVQGAPDIDARADIYAFGTMLYELFTGHRAWAGDSVFWVASRRIVEPPPDPRAARPDMPTQAAALVMRCMARAKADRFQSADEVLVALAAIAKQKSIAPPSGVVRLATPVTVKSVAVLPFVNRGAAADEYVADGLTDDLIDVLSMTPGLRVCGRGAVMTRASGSGDAREIGRDLGVNVVVEGSIRRSEDRLRVSARLISVGDGFQLWAKRFDRTEGAFFEVNDEVARAVADALTCKLEQAPREAATDPVALDLYLRARHEYFKYWRENVIASIALFEQALARAPDDPMILAGYAIALARRATQDDSIDAHIEGAERAAERAIALSSDSAAPSTSALARVALAHARLQSGRAVDAAREIRRVLEQNPRSADALDLAGRLLLETGPTAEGIRRLEQALELEPNLFTPNLEIAKFHALVGDRAASDAFFGDEPSNPGLSTIYWFNRCRAALWLSDWERPKAWRTLLEARGNTFPGVLSMLRALTGDLPTDEKVQMVLNVASSGTRLLRRRALYAQIACEFATFLGHTELALRALETADAGLLLDATWLELCAPLAPIRAEPRFQAVRERVLARAGEVRSALGMG